MSRYVDAPRSRVSGATLSGSCWRMSSRSTAVDDEAGGYDGRAGGRSNSCWIQTKPPCPRVPRSRLICSFTPFGTARLTRRSRFRRAGSQPGASMRPRRPRRRAEMAFHRLLFFADSPATPWAGERRRTPCSPWRIRRRPRLDLTRPRSIAIAIDGPESGGLRRLVKRWPTRRARPGSRCCGTSRRGDRSVAARRQRRAAHVPGVRVAQPSRGRRGGSTSAPAGCARSAITPIDVSNLRTTRSPPTRMAAFRWSALRSDTPAAIDPCRRRTRTPHLAPRTSHRRCARSLYLGRHTCVFVHA